MIFLYHFYSNKQDRREKILEMTYYSKPIKKGVHIIWDNLAGTMPIPKTGFL